MDLPYAQVIVDLSAEAVDRLFTYSVPEGMILLPGQQVEVPFGPRRLEGFVVSLSEKTELDPHRVRPVLRAVRDYPIILPELMELADWMHKRYLCNLVDALRLMIPAEMRGGRVREKTARLACLQASAEEIERFAGENKRAAKQIALLRRLADGPVRAAEISEKSALKALVDKGLVAIREEETRRTPTGLRNQNVAADPELMPGQARAVDELVDALQTGGGRYLLHGVTGSGKTEVYIRLVREVLAEGKTAIVLVPEIALTPQMVSWFHARFGADAAVLHSRLSAGERYDEWRRIRRGEARVVIGARSAVFAPVEALGAIIVDEEHEHTYQSDKRPCYDAREVAWQRAKRAGAVLVLGSATPSITTYMRAMPGVRPENRIELIELDGRVKNRPLPEVELVDMRRELQQGNNTVLSGRLVAALDDCLRRGEQAMLFINRRGYSTFVSCRACGYVVKCPNCDVSLTFHQSENALMCHYCGETEAMPRKCPQCGSPYIKQFGAGTEKVEEEVRRRFPTAVCLRMDNDTTREKDAHERILTEFREGRANVLIGTQMIAKGLDFPRVTVVGIVAADMTLNLPDYRSIERTFQLITQMAGRAGRAELPGRVIVQTYDPDHYGIKLAAAQDYRAFYNRESVYRRQGLYPPFTTIMRIVYSGRDPEAVQHQAEADEAALNAFLDHEGHRPDIVQMRALEAPIKLLRGETRWQVFLKMYFKGNIDAVSERMRALADAAPEGIRAELEINPNNMF